MKRKITHSALHQRVNRKLAKVDEKLYKTNPNRSEHQDLGEYYIVNTMNNSIVASHCDLKTVAKEIGALKEFEELES